MATYVELQVDGSSATINGFLDADRKYVEVRDGDVLSDYDAKDYEALMRSNLSQQMKTNIHKSALSFKAASPGGQQGASQGSLVSATPQTMMPGAPHPDPAQMMPKMPPMGPPPAAMQGVPPTMPPPRPSITVPVVARDVNVMSPTSPMPPCQWFSPTAINKIEVEELKACFPELSATTQVRPDDLGNLMYLQLRNTLIDVYRANSGTKLTLAECRKHCDGDLSALIRLLSFLERHRLVNYALANNAAANSGSNMLDPATKKLKEELTNHWTTTPTCSTCDRICLYSFYVLSPSVYGSCLPYSTLRTAVWCQDCIKEIPQSQCLLKVNLPALHIPGGTVNWSEQQICALFDSIESLGPDWVAVSKAVSAVQGNPIRTPRECLAAFLSMPLSEQAPSLAHDSQDNRATRARDAEGENPPADPEAEKFALDLLLTAMDLLQQRSNEIPQVASTISTVASSRLQEIVSSSTMHDGTGGNGMDSLLATNR